MWVVDDFIKQNALLKQNQYAIHKKSQLSASWTNTGTSNTYVFSDSTLKNEDGTTITEFDVDSFLCGLILNCVDTTQQINGFCLQIGEEKRYYYVASNVPLIVSFGIFALKPKTIDFGSNSASATVVYSANLFLFKLRSIE